MNLSLLSTHTHDPYHNLALEEHLLSLAGDEIILYLWQNRHTVVIGRNQNAVREVNLARLAQAGGLLARRLSGGGAVYHDLGNLNFTFIAPRARYDLARQTRVILEAARALRVPAEASGRNDILAGGRKFSGNAFYRRGDTWYHHGTLLIHTDLDALDAYLNVSPEKLRLKGVPSVKGRVCNLCEFVPSLEPAQMREAMRAAFSSVYGGEVEPFDEGRINPSAVDALSRRISSPGCLLGERAPGGLELERRFAWGGLQLALHIEQGRIAACRAYSDAMDEQAVADLPARLAGCPIRAEAFDEALSGWGEGSMRSDVREMLMEL